MKQINSWFVLMIVAAPLFCQAQEQEEFSGKWVSAPYSAPYKDTIKLNFLDGHKVIAQIGSRYIIEGQYKSRLAPRNKGTILSIKTSSNAKDSLIIILFRTGEEEYRLKEVMHFYWDRPPESELMENFVYMLRKEKGE
jgi:hypothetical protein